MSSNAIERKIDELEDFLETCKYKPMSKDYIMVNRERIDILIDELRDVIPDEVERYRKVLDQKDQIFADAKAQASALIQRATEQMNQQINDEEIMKQAYDQANQMVTAANQQALDKQAEADGKAKETIDAAQAQAEQIIANAHQQAAAIVDAANQKVSDYNTRAQSYLSEMLEHLEQLTQSSIQETSATYQGFIGNMHSYLQTIQGDRAALIQQQQQAAAARAQEQAMAQQRAMIQAQQQAAYEQQMAQRAMYEQQMMQAQMAEGQDMPQDVMPQDVMPQDEQ